MKLCQRCQNAIASCHGSPDPFYQGIHPLVKAEDEGAHLCGMMVNGVCNRPVCCEDGGGITYRLAAMRGDQNRPEGVAYGDRVMLAAFAEGIAQAVEAAGGWVLRSPDRWSMMMQRHSSDGDLCLTIDPAWWFAFRDGIPWEIAKRGEV